MNAEERRQVLSLAGQIGALRLHALHDSKELTKNARAVSAGNLRVRLYAEVDAARPGLPDAEREIAFQRLWTAHFKGLRLTRTRKQVKKVGAK